MLLYGPPDWKDTIAHIIANEMGSDIKSNAGLSSKRPAILRFVDNLGEGDVLFIDEIHRLNPTIEEVLYRRWRLPVDIIIGQGPSARS